MPQRFVILSPVAGTGSADEVHQALERHFNCDDGSCQVHVLQLHDDLTDLARTAAARGSDLVIAAGGDGTVGAVADGLVGSEARLGIVPMGTANVLARELGIPVDLDGALGLLAGPFATAELDALKVEGRHYFTQVGVGIDALMIRDTPREQKRRFGRLAYIWTGLARLIGFQPRRFRLEIDGRAVRTRASQVLVANCGTLGQAPFRWGSDIRPNDGRADVCIVRAKSALDYLSLSWRVLTGRHRADRNVHYQVAARAITIDVERHPLPVQADGEIIGQTPLTVEVVPSAVRVVVPEQARE